MANNVQFNIKLKVDGKDQVVTASTSVRELEEAVRSSQKGFSSAMRAVNDWGFAISNAVGSIKEVSQTLNELTSENKAFSASMAAANTMAGKSSEELANLKSQVSALSREIPIARDALANGLYQVISNGVPEDNWIDYLNKSAKASVGGIADLEEVVKVTSTVIKNYAMSWDDAGTIQDKIQLTAKNGVTSFEQMAQALPRVTANAATLGISVDELMASFATLTGVSGNTAEVSTQLAAIMTALIKPSSEAANMAQEMGIKFDAAAIKAAGGMQNFLTQLDADIKSYAASTGTLETEIYGRLFGSAEALRALVPLTGNLADKFAENVDAMKGSAGTIDEAFATMSGTSSAAMQKMKNAIGDVTDAFAASISTVQSVVNSMALMGSAILPVYTLVRILKEANAAQLLLASSVARSSVAYLAFGTNTRRVAAAMSVLSNASRSAATSAVALKVALRGVLIASGVGIAIAAVSSAISALIDKMESGASAVQSMTAAQRQEQQAAQTQANNQRLLADAAGDVTAKFQALQTQWRSLKTEADKTAFIKQNQSAFAELGLHINDVNSAYNTFVSNAPKVVAALTSIAKAEAYKDIYKDAVKNKATNYKDNVRYARAKAGDAVKTDAVTGQPLAEYAAAGIKLTTSGVKGGMMARQQYNALSADDARKLNAYRYQQASGAKAEERKGYDDNIADAAKNLTAALTEAAQAQKTLGTAGVKAETGAATTSSANHQTAKTNTPSPKSGSIDWYEKQMQQLREQINASVDEGATSQLQGKYLDLEAKLKQLKIRVGIDKPDKVREEMSKTLSAVPLTAEPQQGAITKPLQATADMRSNAEGMIGNVRQNFEVGLIGIDEAQKQIDTINDKLKELGLKPVEINLKSDKAMQTLNGAATALSSLGSAFSAAAKEFEMPELDVAGILAQSIAQIIFGYAQATMMASTLGPWAWIAFAATGLATMITMIASISSASSGFATGGIIGGSSYTGDKVIARVNSGEMILNAAQQARLFAIANGAAVYGTALASTTGYGTVGSSSVKAELQRLQGIALEGQRDTMSSLRLKVKGRDLVTATANETNLSAKSGRKSNILT